MAEFCLECWNKMNGTCETEKDWKLSKVLELCEGCGEYKQIIVAPKNLHIDWKLRVVNFLYRFRK